MSAQILSLAEARKARERAAAARNAAPDSADDFTLSLLRDIARKLGLPPLEEVEG